MLYIVEIFLKKKKIPCQLCTCMYLFLFLFYVFFLSFLRIWKEKVDSFKIFLSVLCSILFIKYCKPLSSSRQRLVERNCVLDDGLYGLL